MAAPYTSVTVSNYNSNPPADDGTSVSTNQLLWSNHKTKLGDPLKTAVESTQTNLTTAFAKLVGGAGVGSTAISYSVVAGDQGKLIRATASGVTITTPDATSVSSPFVFGVVNDSTGDITLDGSGSQTINGNANVTIPKTRGLLIYTDGSNWFAVGTTWHAELRALPFSTPRGRLTLESGVPISVSDQTAKTTVYFTPYKGNTIMLPDANGDWALYGFSELSQALSDSTKSPSATTANNVYDVFGWIDGSTIRATRGPAWTSATARGTGAGTTQISLLNGVPINTVAITNGPGASRGVYLATFVTDSNNQVNYMILPAVAAGGGNNRIDIWNMYNRIRVTSVSRDSTDTWASASGIRAANNNNSNRITYVVGQNDQIIDAEYKITGSSGSACILAAMIGLDSTSAMVSGGIPGTYETNGTGIPATPMTGVFRGFGGLGQHYVQALEYGNNANGTWRGDDAASTFTQMGLSLSLEV